MRTTLVTAFALALLVGCSAQEQVTAQSSGGDDTSDGGGGGDDCTWTQGYWKNHEDAWPASSLVLGSVSYSQTELLAILHEPVRGNGLISLAHQLIAAKLNVLAGADDTAIADEIAAADALIDMRIVPPVGSGYLAPSVASSLVGALDAFNNSSGDTCDGDDGPSCGNGVVESGEQCDDGGTTSGDGCSSTCQTEAAPCCGNGIVESGEQCDDGNTTSGDGCSSTCQSEMPSCGNGVIEPGEECDDGNTHDGDGCTSTCHCEYTKPTVE